MPIPGVSGRSLTLGLVSALLLGAAASAQKFRTYTDEKKGFRVKMLRWVKQVPTQPLEQQILAKWSGVKKARVAKDKKDNDKGTVAEPQLEFWLFAIGKRGPITESGSQDNRVGEAKDITEKARIELNKGADLDGFLKRRINPVLIKAMSKVTRNRALRGPDRMEFEIQEARIRNVVILRTYTLTFDSEYLGLVVLGKGPLAIPDDMSEDIDRIAASVRRIDVKEQVAAVDPYKDSDLPMIERRRVVRQRLEPGWSAHDTPNFILISDMVSNTYNRRLLREMLTDLEVMRVEYEKAFPPQEKLTAVSTVRVCNSYAGYQRYSNKPGTGGYWHPIAEELVLFNPSKTVKKDDWMKLVTPKAILYHEAMHQYFHYSNGSVPPASWFNEGYGEYFGGARINRFEKRIKAIEKNAFRWDVVKKHRDEGKWPKLAPMLKMTQQQFYSRKTVSQNYAFGWAFCYFLELERRKPVQEQNRQWAAIPQDYIKNLREAAEHFRNDLPADAPKGSILRMAIPIQKRAFDRTFKDVDLDKLEAAWIAAMKQW